MSDYDPRTSTGIPTEPVGSLPLPAALRAAYAGYEAGTVSQAQVRALQEKSAKDSIERYAATGSPLISDGAQRWPAFPPYPIADMAGDKGFAPGEQFFVDGHGLPVLERGPFRYHGYAADSLKKSLVYAKTPMKQAVVAPSTMDLLYPFGGELPGYSRDDFEADVLDGAEQDVRRAFDAGASRVSLDFTEGRLAAKKDPRNPWAGLLSHFIEVNNRLLDRFTAAERGNIGIHICADGVRDSARGPVVPYRDLVPSMFGMNVGYFLVRLAAERDKDPVCAAIGEYLRGDANGVAQSVYIGVIDPLNPRVESAEEVRDTLIRAANFIPKEQLGSTDDCGFYRLPVARSPRGSPERARAVAFRKIANRVRGTRMAAEKLGIDIP